MYHAKERMFARSFKGNERNRQISSMKWGTGRTDRMLFFATEHPDSERNDGEAYAANYSDESSTEALYPFPGVPGGGAVMALDGTGSRLAIVAGRSDNRARQSLMIYEPQLLDADTVLECRLPEFGYIAHPASLSGECHIMDVQFSPCGSYIAVARDNNCALIYDIRNAAKPLHVFGHVTYSRDDMESRFGERWGSKAAYGISNLGWIGHNTIITGGADGCVRRWNTNVATRNMGGKVIARLDQPVAHLSFADDTLEHRYPLIAYVPFNATVLLDVNDALQGRHGRQSICLRL
ncbi:hypothetical protein CALVIDRAFT_249155 [Calocera viscosa TUFC12733]|uniref:WD40 repeat-like protein n=1 Tax=Calocera viscosa (strain TUFC12733) TaxID=1330018 RepID=A0A167JCP9_CALVF|nr:hypothetical protein CALVIDRAFT_249155 [Calocera viscosa TUFC12733]